MSGLLDGKVVFVTGCATGIGHASARLFAHEGATLALADRDVTNGRSVESGIVQSGGRARFFAADVTDDASVGAAVLAAIKQFGRVDCAFNNAGVAGDAPAETTRTADVPANEWAEIVDVNLAGVWRCMKHQIAAMVEQGGGAIVNTASIAGLVGVGGQAAYVASKHGVVGLTRSAAIEYAARAIRVNAICPGFVVTPMTEAVLARAGDALLARVPMRRYGQPNEIGQAAAWLLSDRASYVTGSVIAVDGGFTAQ